MNLSFSLSPCPILCPYDWKTRWKEGRNHCGFVLLTPPLIGPEPKFDSPQPPVPQPVGHIREKTHHPCITRDAARNMFSIRFSVGFCKMNRAALSKTLASSLSPQKKKQKKTQTHPKKEKKKRKKKKRKRKKDKNKRIGPWRGGGRRGERANPNPKLVTSLGGSEGGNPPPPH